MFYRLRENCMLGIETIAYVTEWPFHKQRENVMSGISSIRVQGVKSHPDINSQYVVFIQKFTKQDSE